MSHPIPHGPGRGAVEPCEWCGVVLLVAAIAGCYVAGFGYSGWLAIAIGLHVWLLGWLLIRHRADGASSSGHNGAGLPPPPDKSLPTQE